MVTGDTEVATVLVRSPTSEYFECGKGRLRCSVRLVHPQPRRAFVCVKG